MEITRRCSLSAAKRLSFANTRYYVSMDFDDDDENDEVEMAAKRLTNSQIICKKVKGRYVSPWAKETNKKFWDVVKLLFTKRRPQLQLPNIEDTKSLISLLEVNRRKVRNDSEPHFTWMGHASCYFQSEGTYILTDPVWGERASPVSFAGPKRYIKPPIELEDLKIDLVLLSHTHYDHLDISSAKRIGNRAHW